MIKNNIYLSRLFKTSHYLKHYIVWKKKKKEKRKKTQALKAPNSHSLPCMPPPRTRRHASTTPDSHSPLRI